jgi:arylsulfatase A-like enzyme
MIGHHMRFVFAVRAPARRLFLLLIACLLGSAGQTGASPPDIVIFICDDLSARDLACYGARDVRTPRIDAFARSALIFDRAFVVSPSCAPSRATLLTGMNPARNGAIANHEYKRDDVPSLPPSFRQLGYQSAAFGKVAHGPRDVTRHGFDHTPAHRAFRPQEIDRWLSSRDKDRPVFLMVGTHAPHVPWPQNQDYEPAAIDVPRFHYDTPEYRADRVRYYTDVTQADTDFGAILDLIERQLGPETVVVFTSDHGAQLPFGKWNLYDEGIRVPLLVRWPGLAQAGRSEAMVAWPDLLPTLLEGAGGKAPTGIDGQSFLGSLTNPSQPHRDRIFSTHNNDGRNGPDRANIYPIRSVRTERWKYLRNLQPGWIHSNHSDRFRLRPLALPASPVRGVVRSLRRSRRAQQPRRRPPLR